MGSDNGRCVLGQGIVGKVVRRALHRPVASRQKREVLFSEMQPYELDALYTMPRYFDFERTLQACGLDFLVCNEDVFESLSSLGTRRRAIVLLSYYLGLTDREIGEMIGLERANVQYHRKQALKELRNMMDEKGESL